MTAKFRVATVLALTCGLLAACATQRPVIYSEERLADVDDAGLQRDIDDCRELAVANGANDVSGKRVATKTAKNAAVGGSTNAVMGAITGGSLAGAVVGAASSGISTLLNESFNTAEPTPVHKEFVTKCLSERGYQVMGWQ